MKCLLILSVATASCRAAEVGLLYAAFNGIESGGWIEPENAPVAITADLIKEMAGLTPVRACVIATVGGSAPPPSLAASVARPSLARRHWKSGPPPTAVGFSACPR